MKSKSHYKRTRQVDEITKTRDPNNFLTSMTTPSPLQRHLMDSHSKEVSKQLSNLHSTLCNLAVLAETSTINEIKSCSLMN